jgi:hypothetical protein
MGVFVYADESGHSGRNIFDEKSPTYFQGAIISLGDVDPIINGVVQRHCQALSVPRLHSNQHQEHVVSIICADLLDALEKHLGNFHYVSFTNLILHLLSLLTCSLIAVITQQFQFYGTTLNYSGMPCA